MPSKTDSIVVDTNKLVTGSSLLSAALSHKIVEVAIEVDSAATKEFVSEVEVVKRDTRINKVASVVFTVGGLASGTKGLLDIIC